MIVRTGWLAELRCTECGGAPVVAVSPGSEAPLVLDLFRETRGEPLRAWCMACVTQLTEQSIEGGTLHGA